MLYVTKEIAEQLGDMQIGGTVIELPAYSDKLREATGAIYVIVTGLLSFDDYEAMEEVGAVRTTPEELVSMAGKAGKKAEDIEDYDLDFDDYELNLSGDDDGDFKEDPAKCFQPEKKKPEPEQHDDRPTKKQIAERTPGVQVNRKKETLPSDLMNRPRSFIAAPRRGMVICCFSSAGGVGKTFLSTNLGCIASLNGISTVVCDMDLGYGDVDIATGLTRGPDDKRLTIVDRKANGPKSDWATVTSWRKHARNLKDSILQHHSGLYVLPSFPYAGEGISAPEAEDLLLTLSEIFGLVVVDLGVNAFSPYAKAAISISEIVFIVAKQDAKSIGKISHFLKQEGGYKENMKFVVNMVDPAAHYSPKEIAVECGFRDYDTIPLDVQGASSATKKCQMVAQLKGSPASSALWKIASTHLPYNIPYKETGTEGKGITFSFLAKFFKRK